MAFHANQYHGLFWIDLSQIVVSKAAGWISLTAVQTSISSQPVYPLCISLHIEAEAIGHSNSDSL